MNETFEQCRKNLLRRGFEVRIAATTEEARQILREEIRAAAPETISFGGSMTMEATGIVDELRREGRYRLFDGVDYTLPPEERIEIRRQGLLADLYISGINAITEEGALYWLDGIGNRVAAIAFGPRKVLLVAGRNKIVATRAAAEARIRDIAALLVIDKLPFPPPDDPLVEARSRLLERVGRGAFHDYMLPEAALALKQGAGRLIRDESDRGVLMICDPRMLTKPYGRKVWQSLPPMQRTKELRTVLEFFAASR